MEHESIVMDQCEKLLLRAKHFGASDLHVMPSNDCYLILLRKFGKLVQAGQLPEDLGTRVISYFKFLSSLDISEKRKPQSGAFARELEQQSFAFRVSTLPSIFGKESLVVRLLKQHFTEPLATLCLYAEQAEELCHLVHQRQGLLLVTGATGSGKTTTLYSLIQYCRTALSRHVISLEDPVEISQEHLLQIQVNERAGVTYSAGLKAILRHSPDVIMIGEIRDQETARIAVQASLSGHLVVATIHSKDSVHCLYRLLDLSVSMDEMRQSLVGVVAQQLVLLPNQDTRRAIFEILHDVHLFEAMAATMKGELYTLPENRTLAYMRQRADVYATS